MHKLTIVCLLVSCASFLSACGVDPVNATAPSKTDAMESASASVSPSTLVAQPVATSSCPSVSPYDVRFSLGIRAGSRNVAITGFSVRFTDSRGAQMPQITLPAPIPTTQFGSALVEARSFQQFPMRFGLGCGTGHIGTMTIVITSTDGSSGYGTMTATAPVH